jgi:hypothetical protein
MSANTATTTSKTAVRLSITAIGARLASTTAWVARTAMRVFASTPLASRNPLMKRDHANPANSPTNFWTSATTA